MRCLLVVTALLVLPTSAEAQSIVLVNDSADAALSQHWEDALDSLVLAYTSYGPLVGNGPTAAELSAGEIVIWFSGDVFSGPSAYDEIQLTTFLDGGGHLLLSSQDYLFGMTGVTPFAQTYLGVHNASYINGSDQGDEPLYGIAGDYISDAWPTPTYNYASVGMLYPNFADDLRTTGAAIETFTSGGYWTQVGVIRNEGANFRTMFFGTPFTPLFADPAQGADILWTCLQWLLNGPCDTVDVDGDGYSECDGDCDETDMTIHPSAAETCDDGIDSNCDGQADELADADADGFSNCDGDCDDFEVLAYPGAPEDCDFIDNDCDGLVDEDDDSDGDGYSTCGVPPDCDDSDPAVHPGATEVCNLIDDNCDGLVDEDLDGDGDGVPLCAGDCDDEDPLTFPGAPEACDEVDNDCDGALAEYEYDNDGDGYLECAECDDDDSTVFPGAPEACDDGIDSDCFDDLPETEVDDDGDGFSECAGDCDDDDPATNPDAEEICNEGHDDDCNTSTDEQGDTDMDGYTICGGDCDDNDAGVGPNREEVCDGKDNDCNGDVDDALDYDLDGYTGCGGEDCDDYDANVHPNASEVPYDLIDQDCDGEDLDDIDGDGFQGGPYGNDCDDNDPLVNPGAAEDCEDEIDTDCDGKDDGFDEECQISEETTGDSGCQCTQGRRPPRGLLPAAALLALLLRRRGQPATTR